MALRSALSPDSPPGSPHPPALQDPPDPAAVDEGRLGIYAAMGASAGAVPLPWVPDALARRVRGALVQDVTVRHGLALEPSARDALADPAGPNGKRGIVRHAVRYVGSKLALRALTGLGPVGLIGPVRAALHTYVLGHLLDRYLARRSAPKSERLGAFEARRVRTAIDGALLRALTVDVDPLAAPKSTDDARDETTAFIDSVLSFAAGVPEQLIRRLDAAFDDIMLHELR